MMFLSSSIFGATTAFGVALAQNVANQPMNDPGAQALGGLAGAGLGLLVAPAIYDWVYLKWIRGTKTKKKLAFGLQPWSSVVQNLGPQYAQSGTPVSVVGLQCLFD